MTLACIVLHNICIDIHDETPKNGISNVTHTCNVDQKLLSGYRLPPKKRQIKTDCKKKKKISLSDNSELEMVSSETCSDSWSTWFNSTSLSATFILLLFTLPCAD